MTISCCRSYFGPTGIGYSMLRVPIGGTDFSTRFYTLDDVPSDENLGCFSLADEDFNLRVSLYMRVVLKIYDTTLRFR